MEKYSEEDWKTAQVLYKGKRHAFCLFSLHLCIEKLLKAYFVKVSTDSTPPFVHDLIKISQDAGLSLTPDQIDLLAILNSWNLRCRYPDYTQNLQNKAMLTYVVSQMEKVDVFRKWLEKKI